MDENEAIKNHHSQPDVITNDKTKESIEILTKGDYVNCDKYNEKLSIDEINSEEETIHVNKEECRDKLNSNTEERIRPEVLELLKKLESDILNDDENSNYDNEKSSSTSTNSEEVFYLQKGENSIEIKATDSIEEMVQKYESFKSQQQNICLRNSSLSYRNVCNFIDSGYENDSSFSSTIFKLEDENSTEIETLHSQFSHLEERFDSDYEADQKSNDEKTEKNKESTKVNKKRKQESLKMYSKKRKLLSEMENNSFKLLEEKIKTFDNFVDIIKITSDEEIQEDKNELSANSFDNNDYLWNSMEDSESLDVSNSTSISHQNKDNKHLLKALNRKREHAAGDKKRKKSKVSTYFNNPKNKLLSEAENNSFNSLQDENKIFDILKIQKEEEFSKDKCELSTNIYNTKYLRNSFQYTVKDVTKACGKPNNLTNYCRDAKTLRSPSEDTNINDCFSEMDSEEESITLLEIIDEDNEENILTLFPDLISSVPIGSIYVEKNQNENQIAANQINFDLEILKEDMTSELKTNTDAFLYLSKLRKFFIKEYNIEGLQIVVNLQLAFLFPE